MTIETRKRLLKICSVCDQCESCPRSSSMARKCYQDWYNKNRRDPEVEKLRLALYRQKYFTRWMLSRCKSVALKSGLDFDLDIDWFETELSKGKCAVTDIVFVLPVYQPGARGKRGPWTPSVDRIDNTKGYVKSNCRLVVWIYNLAKSNYEEMDINRMCNELVKKKFTRKQTQQLHHELVDAPVQIMPRRLIMGNWSREDVPGGFHMTKQASCSNCQDRA